MSDFEGAPLCHDRFRRREAGSYMYVLHPRRECSYLHSSAPSAATVRIDVLQQPAGGDAVVYCTGSPVRDSDMTLGTTPPHRFIASK